MKIVLIGAGSAQFGYGMLEDIFQSKRLSGAEIALLDINRETVMKVHDRAQRFITEHGLDHTVTAGTDRAAALAGADHVIISIEVGDRFTLWDQDWTLPQQYGIRQVYGENGGPGGVFHALRIIPPILAICDDIMRICPEAYVFNYSNPMTAIVTTVMRKHPSMKFIGMCHEIASLKRYLPVIMDTPLENISFRAAGLNHFSVMLEASYRDSGKDAFDLVMERAPALFEKEPGYSDVLAFAKRTGATIQTEGATERFLSEVTESSRAWSDRTLFKKIMDHFGLLPITSDSHIGEYIPWAYDAADHRGILDFYAFYRYSLAQEAPQLKMKSEAHERAVPIMEALLDDTGMEEAAVNILNEGLIPDMPARVAVEVPAIINKDGITGIAFPDYPKGFGALLRNYTGTYDLLADAILQGSRDLVIQALLVNPIVNDVNHIPELVDIMIERQEQWLGYLK
jgi:alpha-galactosidase